MADASQKVALVTGGSGGMGYAIAQALAARGGWQIHILDLKEDEGQKAASSLPHTTFHKANISDYDQLAAVFKTVFIAGGKRLDLCIANAGIFERPVWFDLKADSDEPPPPPDYAALEVNTKGTINTAHLARFYMIQSPEKGSIVITASCSSIWPTIWAPIYTASKFGILGFVRAASGFFKSVDGIRLNAICPGAMRTTIIPEEAWEAVPEDVFTPLDLIAEVTLKLAYGEEIVDAKGVKIPAQAYGQALVANGRNFYLHPAPEYCDDAMKRTMESTEVDKHV